MNLAQQKIASALRKHLRIPRKILDPIINNSLKESNNISFNLSGYSGELPGGIKNYIFFVSPEKEVRIGHLWNFKKFEKTGIYASYIDAKYNMGSDLIFCFIGTDPFVIYENEGYYGLGGIFCSSKLNENSGFIIEPLKNYLKYNFPVYWEEDSED